MQCFFVPFSFPKREREREREREKDARDEKVPRWHMNGRRKEKGKRGKARREKKEM